MNDDYSQPTFYRFNQDSLKLVQWIKKTVPSSQRILDLGAGCGIIGMELSKHFHPQILSLVELQLEYLTHLEKNKTQFVPAETTTETLMTSFREFHPSMTYDLIVSNPPYYLPRRGQISTHVNKARARSFIVDGWEILLEKIQLSLSPQGRAFLVMKSSEMVEVKKRINKSHLEVLYHPHDTVVIIELFTLDKNRDHQLF